MKKVARPKGTRDFLPPVMRQRQAVIDKVRGIFERYGYEPMETPALERWDVLKGKFGEEGEQLLFKILRRGGALDELRLNKREQVTFEDFDEVVDLALRYDLTVPFSRVLAMHPDLPKPFKRYQIQPVWRADRPQKGRFREFYQCDVDVAGTSDMVADAEIIAITHDIMKELGFRQFRIRLNHRKLLNGLVAASGGAAHFTDICVAVDKLDKIGEAGVSKELASRGIPTPISEDVMEWVKITGAPDALFPLLEQRIAKQPEGVQGLAELRELYDALTHLGVDLAHVPLDLSMVRGLDYYTGPIFETVVEEPSVGTLCAGGRYDDLIAKFSGQSIPATGGSIGLERIIVVMEELGMLTQLKRSKEVLVTIFSPELLGSSLAFAQRLRAAGISTEVFLKPKTKLQQQLRYAGKADIPIVAILGPDEIEAQKVTLRLDRDNQFTVSFDEAPEKIRTLLNDL